jgi:D-amino-acid dehydrogenase
MNIAPGLPLSPTTMRPSPPRRDGPCDVLVIGGGIVGTTVARELQAAGRSVLLLERTAVGQACSLGNAGWVTPCFAMPLPQPGMLLKSIGWLLDSSSPLHIRPALDPLLLRWLCRFLLAMNRGTMLRSVAALTAVSTYSLRFYAELATRQPGPLCFEKRGLLMVSATRSGLAAAREEMAVMADCGIPGRGLSREEALDFEPLLRPGILGGVFFPEEAQIDPLQATLAVTREFESLGGTVLERHEVFDFDLRADRTIETVHTTQGRFRPELVVLASGSWSTEMARRLGLSVPILGGKGYSMTLEAPPGGTLAMPARPIMIVDRKIAVTPYPDRLRVAGTLELVNQDMSISPRRLAAIHSGAHEFLRLTANQATPARPRDIWRGLRPCTPDGVPVVGFSRRVPNLFYCTGHQMLGLQSAPGTARLAVELLTRAPTLTDPEPFSARRWE